MLLKQSCQIDFEFLFFLLIRILSTFLNGFRYLRNRWMVTWDEWQEKPSEMTKDSPVFW